MLGLMFVAMNATVTRDDFMRFFRDDEALATLTTDDRFEIFLQILPGASEITPALLEELMWDYCVDSKLEISPREIR